MPKAGLYDVVDGKLVRKKKACPKCGEGVFMAEHSNRVSCGKCGYTEFQKKAEPKPKGKKETAPTPDTGAPSLFEE